MGIGCVLVVAYAFDREMIQVLRFLSFYLFIIDNLQIQFKIKTSRSKNKNGPYWHGIKISIHKERIFITWNVSIKNIQMYYHWNIYLLYVTMRFFRVSPLITKLIYHVFRFNELKIVRCCIFAFLFCYLYCFYNAVVL